MPEQMLREYLVFAVVVAVFYCVCELIGGIMLLLKTGVPELGIVGFTIVNLYFVIVFILKLLKFWK